MLFPVTNPQLPWEVATLEDQGVHTLDQAGSSHICARAGAEAGMQPLLPTPETHPEASVSQRSAERSQSSALGKTTP